MEEVDAVIKEGWTKAGIDKMHKIYSFLRETQRVDSFTLSSLDSFSSILSERYRFVSHILVPFNRDRLALRPFTFSNGVTVPTGTLISIPASAIHTDE